jgi:Na+/melibiose symporter-like transporter
MPGALTLDPRERHSPQSWRLACRLSAVDCDGYCPAAGLTARPGQRAERLFLCHEPDKRQDCAVLLLFPDDHERYSPRNDTSGSMLTDLKLLGRNSQWRIVFLFNILLLTAVVRAVPPRCIT